MNNSKVEKRYADFLTLKKIVPHDINNALGGISGNVQLLQMDYEGEDEKYLVGGKILEGTKKMVDITEELNSGYFPHPITTFPEGINPPRTMSLYESRLIRQSKKMISHALDIVEHCEELEGRRADIIKYNSERIMDVAMMAAMGNISKEKIANASVCVDPKEETQKIISFYNNKIQEGNYAIGIKFHYDEVPNVCANRGIINGVLYGLVGNAYERALPGTSIEIGLRKKNNDLEWVVEELHDGKPKRETAGLGEGVGLEFIKKVVGKENYSQIGKTQLSKYISTQAFGDKGADQYPEDAEIYSTKIVVSSLKELVQFNK